MRRRHGSYFLKFHKKNYRQPKWLNGGRAEVAAEEEEGEFLQYLCVVGRPIQYSSMMLNLDHDQWGRWQCEEEEEEEKEEKIKPRNLSKDIPDIRINKSAG